MILKRTTRRRDSHLGRPQKFDYHTSLRDAYACLSLRIPTRQKPGACCFSRSGARGHERIPTLDYYVLALKLGQTLGSQLDYLVRD